MNAFTVLALTLSDDAPTLVAKPCKLPPVHAIFWLTSIMSTHSSSFSARMLHFCFRYVVHFHQTAFYCSVWNSSIAGANMKCVATSNTYHEAAYMLTMTHISQIRASQRLRPVAISARLAPSHASYHSPELVWATGRLMLPDRSFGTSCLLHCGRLTFCANSEDSWKRFCLSSTRLQRLVTLAFRCLIRILLHIYLRKTV